MEKDETDLPCTTLNLPNRGMTLPTEYGSKRAAGWRDILDIHKEEKQVKKSIGGKEVIETKQWQYYELGP